MVAPVERVDFKSLDRLQMIGDVEVVGNAGQAEPHRYVGRSLIGLVHAADLRIPLGGVALVDADGVRPELDSDPLRILAEIIEAGPEVGSHVKHGLVVQVNVFRCFAVTPGVGDGGIGRCSRPRNLDEVKVQRVLRDGERLQEPKLFGVGS